MQKKFNGGQCKRYKFQSYIKFSKVDEKRILEKIQVIGSKNKDNMEKLEAKTFKNEYNGSCPTLLTLIQKSHKLEELLEIVYLGKDVIDVTKFKKITQFSSFGYFSL